MWLVLGILLLITWVLCFLVFHITAFLIHLLLIFSILCFIIYFARKSTA